MRPDALAAAIESDRGAGKQPFFVSATVGTTSSNAIDPLRPIGEICRRYGLWLHVDAAMSGTAALCPEFRWIHEGLELADSYCFNPHKWMFTNFDCDAFWVADRASLVRALSVLPEYLRNRATESGAVIDYRDWQVPLGRRFRALKLWFVIRHYGVEGLRHHVRRHIALAQAFREWVERRPALRAGRARAAESRLLPPRRRRRGERKDPRDRERVRPVLPHAHEARRAVHAAPFGRPDVDRGAPRSCRLGCDLQRRRLEAPGDVRNRSTSSAKTIPESRSSAPFSPSERSPKAPLRAATRRRQCARVPWQPRIHASGPSRGRIG